MLLGHCGLRNALGAVAVAGVDGGRVEEGEMTLQITPTLLYLRRREWSPDVTLPRLGYTVPRDRRTHAILHHTVVIDDDATPNVWESLSEIKMKMRQLQVIRPDLGLDVPYNDVGFLMEGGRLVVCEGRGQDRTGAHTHGHNTEGYALALEGNFELARDIGPWVPALSRFWGWLKYERGMRNLGVVRPPRGVIWGHRNFTQTACPGVRVMARIEDITFAEEDDMVSQEEFDKLRDEMEAVNKFQNELLVGQNAAIDFLAKLAVDQEARIDQIMTQLQPMG